MNGQYTHGHKLLKYLESDAEWPRTECDLLVRRLRHGPSPSPVRGTCASTIGIRTASRADGRRCTPAAASPTTPAASLVAARDDVDEVGVRG